ncbi:MAG TPA: hypothetical protein VL137_09900, partial [Polyangiaceae bacterium]|nr:hypothetical protein [Polyangiaceae bacterium]
MAATLVLVEQACSNTQDHPARAPLHQAQVSNSTQHPAASPGASSTAPSQSYDLQGAVPLLALTSLRPVMEALDEGEAEEALRLAQQTFVQAKPEGKQAKRWSYLLARLAEGAGDLNAAKERYRAVGAEPWALSNYAQFAAARIELRMGNARGALDQAQHIVAPPPLSGLVDRLAADAASQIGAADIALVRYGACLNATPLPDGWQQIALSYARLLIESEEKNKGKEGSSAAGGSLGGALYWLKKLSREASADLNVLGELSQRATQLLPESERLSALQLSTDERLAQIEALLAQRRLQEAENAAQDLYAAQATTPFSTAACEARFLRAKALSGLSQWGKAVELLSDALKHCTDDNLKARAGFLAGKCAFSDKRYAATVALMGGVEANPAKGTLGDDARLYTALAYKELQDDAHFADSLTRMLDDYPDGDMTREGAFRLALAKLSNRDYRAAIALLTRAGGLPDADPDSEQAGRENYFLARAQLEAGDKEAGLTGLGTLIESRPMSYYMLHAFSRLAAIDASRARDAMEKGIHRATEAPFTFEHRDVRPDSAGDDPALERGLELLQVGDLDSA